MVTQGDPVEAFARLQARHDRCVWLDGGGARDWSRRRSLLGWLDEDDVSLSYDARTREVTRHAGGRSTVVGDDPFTVLEAELAAGRPTDQWFGYFGYAARPDLPAEPDPDLPDAVWLRPSNIREYEHQVVDLSSRLLPVATVNNRRNPRSGGDSDTLPPDYAAAFSTVQEHLHAGNSYEVNLTYRTRTPSALSPAAAYLRLRSVNPAPYAGFLQHDVPGARAWLLSSSPERYALVTEDRTLETKPIKGTTPRGTTPEEDEEARAHLAGDPKFRAENLMIVDLLRNDLAMVCEAGSVEVPVLMEVESYASVHQLVSTVRGRLRDDVSTVGALKALFPAGSMTGAPKLRTMEIIEEVEGTPRGAYSGAFGWVSGDGRADLGVVIRTLVTAGDDYLLGTGGGITVASDVVEEYAETGWKAARLLAAVSPQADQG
ncbi:MULTISPECIES: anthranilate synthase component I family protein [unclassified Nocardioides]|uniref:anthranilate synthase component I family protein n=1 Tax=unclassified Nocardioides TaxID=2615069 RepID=UPI000702B69C|nr:MULTISPECIES: anthranilate synthase component I family protein [unclassified Nocardioides]KRC53208.1 anthranilate synthase [Nocardioides sp. Root79]KRC70545.1 anthranilate synthase [Nocardioides sp. Root240]